MTSVWDLVSPHSTDLAGVRPPTATHPWVERDDLVKSLRMLTGEAMAGRGRLVMLGGEAGSGKSSLATELVAGLPSDVTARVGASDNVTTPAPLGPFLEALPELDMLVQSLASHRHQLFQMARSLLSAGPTLLVLEDLHWADEATLDLLRWLGRRVESIPALIVATYRADEVDAQHPLSFVLGDLATAPGLVRLDVPNLSVAGVASLLMSAGSEIDAGRLHSRTGGNPFFVTEVIASGADDLPATVRDAVFARVSRLAAGARQVLSALAVLGPQADLELLLTVSGGSIADVDGCFRSGVVVGDRGVVRFRHELARLAIEETLPLALRIDLNAKSLAELVGRQSHDDRRLAHFAVASGNREAVNVYAPRAARLSASLGAHREAAQHYRTALSWLEPSAPTRAGLMEQLACALHKTGLSDEALEVRQELLSLHRGSGDSVAIGRSLRWVSRLEWVLARNAQSERHAAMAVETLEAAEPGHELAMAYSNLAHLRMAAGDLVVTRHWADLAIELATRLGDRGVLSHAQNSLGTALMISGDHEQGRELLHRSLAIALEDEAEDHAARAYANFASSSVVNRRYAEAEETMSAGIQYCADRNLDQCHLDMLAWLARSESERGDFEAARSRAAAVLNSPYASPTVRIPALAVAGQIAAWRGEDSGALLDEALQLALSTGEPQRLIPVVVARADAAWVTGRGDIGAEIDRVWELNSAAPHLWNTGELAWWLHVADVERPLPGPIAEPYALMLGGRFREAARVWREVGSPFWAARALGLSDDPDDAREAWRLLNEQSAPGVLHAMLRDRRARGQSIPRGPRGSSSDHPAGLTVREHEVLVLLVEGMTNAEIAQGLFLSTKTIGHHVSAILHKLEAPTRTRAAAIATERGLLSGRDAA